MTKRKDKGRALFYTRDSGGKHEMTPGEYVAWAQRTAEKLGGSFDGTPDVIKTMITNGVAVQGDVFLDYNVKGNTLSREGLDALFKIALSDLEVTHVLIPRRDRLARPDYPVDGIKLENTLRLAGVTLVFMDKILAPLKKGKRQDIAELIVAAVDYDRSGQERRDLAQKIIYAQIRLAKLGFSAGGRAPYGFCRWLVNESGTQIRQLADGECVKMRGHHVAWLPGPDEEWVVIRRVLRMLETMPASRVGQVLTSEGVPTPDHNRSRTDNGVRHRTSGVWHQNTVTNIARNPLLLAVVEYGRRAMGDQLRCTPYGPRELEDADFCASSGKAKVICNPPENRITAAARFDVIVDPERHRQLLSKLDERGRTQRGKPRSRDPNKNPLGCRVVDMNCGWPMYRTPYKNSFRYKCGLYLQSHGATCDHNHVDGPTATRFMLSCIRQRVLSPQGLHKLGMRIRALAAAEQHHNPLEQEIARKRSDLVGVEKERDQISQNLARANTDEQYQAIAAVFDELSARAKSLRAEITAAEQPVNETIDEDYATDSAMQIIRGLPQLARDPEDLGVARQLFELVDARLYLGFHAVKVKNRRLNKIQSGVVTFGAARPPIKVYEGLTARKKVLVPIASYAAGCNNGLDSPSNPENCDDSGREDKSLRNVSRGERI